MERYWFQRNITVLWNQSFRVHLHSRIRIRIKIRIGIACWGDLCDKHITICFFICFFSLEEGGVLSRGLANIRLSLPKTFPKVMSIHTKTFPGVMWVHTKTFPGVMWVHTKTFPGVMWVHTKTFPGVMWVHTKSWAFRSLSDEKI